MRGDAMAQLRELARAAKSERWYGPEVFRAIHDDDGERLFEDADAEWIAAANPTVFLGLLDERDRLREALREVVRKLGPHDYDLSYPVLDSLPQQAACETCGRGHFYPAREERATALETARAALRGSGAANEEARDG